ncbi:type II toxin-antitoxin system Phd/YefM family antitoxin [Paraconexibacter algicola]|uniref:Antitoxin n=1 Tax=Paraconexibacter algicola TaxID=2133960 RepID=A0A2T4UKR9_9ACTN|nr:type II toxin-antitoxin system prevent-host-death family antitoxin [Paraconexibacter algicola]PTL59839.1 type II toxin-antitoxin system prevent-host-death family antitoxin [Paraconexibacter algicola]
MKTVGIHEAKTNLSSLMREVEAGAEVLVTRGGRPVAKLVPVVEVDGGPREVRGRGLFKHVRSSEVDLPGDEELYGRMFGILPSGEAG